MQIVRQKFGGEEILSYFCGEKGEILMCVVEKNPRSITVRMSHRRWRRMLELEQAYRLARTIKHSMQQMETTPSVSVEDALKTLRDL
jgi:hypothetical protein